MQTSQRSTVFAAALAFVTCGSALQAQKPQPLRLPSPPPHVLTPAEPIAHTQAPMLTAQGELMDVDSKASRIKVKTETGEMTFRVNDQTRVVGAQKSVADLAAMTGSQAVVMFRKDVQGDLATTIDVETVARRK